MIYTDAQLKKALEKMLPDKINLKRDGSGDLFWMYSKEYNPEAIVCKPVLDTELSELCLIIERALSPEAWEIYSYSWDNIVPHFRARCTATWQKKTEVLAKFKEIEL